jgi:hypothetical protein
MDSHTSQRTDGNYEELIAHSVRYIEHRVDLAREKESSADRMIAAAPRDLIFLCEKCGKFLRIWAQNFPAYLVSILVHSAHNQPITRRIVVDKVSRVSKGTLDTWVLECL